MVVILLAMAVIGVVRPFLADVRRQGGIGKLLTSFQAPTIQAAATVHDVLHRDDRHAADRGALPWAFAAKLVPMIVGTIALLVAGVSLFNEMCRKPTAAAGGQPVDQAQAEVEQTIHADQKIHMDLESDTGHLPLRTIVTRSARFFGYLLAFMASMALIGLIPTACVFVIVFMRLEGPETLEADHPLRGRADPRHLRRLRLVHGDPLAADPARLTGAGGQDHPLGAVAGSPIPALRQARWCGDATPQNFVRLRPEFPRIARKIAAKDTGAAGIH